MRVSLAVLLALALALPGAAQRAPWAAYRHDGAGWVLDTSGDAAVVAGVPVRPGRRVPALPLSVDVWTLSDPPTVVTVSARAPHTLFLPVTSR
jgi:hypothetical protein